MSFENEEIHRQLIKKLKLELLEMEGGYFRQTYLSRDLIPEKNQRKGDPELEQRSFCSAIYFLITPGSYSHLHCLGTDELFHFYWGDPVDMWQISPEGSVHHILMGPNPLINQQPQVLVPAGYWQASRLSAGGRFALLGTTMSPAFQWTDFRRPSSLLEIKNLCPPEYHPLMDELW